MTVEIAVEVEDDPVALEVAIWRDSVPRDGPGTFPGMLMEVSGDDYTLSHTTPRGGSVTSAE